MEQPATQPLLPLRSVGTVILPRFEQNPGPLHTILQDADGNIYYTDEINHFLASLTATGEIRWHRGGRGNGMGEFHYPKGMELGWITENHGKTRCIAVCDSWNRRIQFFDLDGGFLGSWKAAGELPFSDAVDIRFIDASAGSDENHSCWLVLDRGHHCLLGLDLAGLPLFRIGRPFYENLEPKWPTPNSLAAEPRHPVDLIRESSSYDPLFMPLRIFGCSQEALFIWEPNSRRLKQVFLGNLLPVWIEPPTGAEWIGADARGLIAFNHVGSLICSYDSDGRIWQSAPVNGIPVPSGRSSNEIWLQDGLLVHHLIFAPKSETDSVERTETGAWALSQGVDEIEHILCSSVPTLEISQLQEAGNLLCSLSRKALEAPTAEWSASFSAEASTRDVASLQQKLAEILSHMQGFSHTLFLIFLKLQMLRFFHPSVRGQEQINRALAHVGATTRPVMCIFEQVLLFRDEWLLAYLARAAMPGCAPESAEMEKAILNEHSTAIMRAIIDLARWLWFVPISDALSKMPYPCDVTQESKGAGNRPRLCLARPCTPARKPSGYLRELDRIFLGGGGITPAFPAAISHTGGMGLLVTLHNASQVLRLNEQGKVLGPLEEDPSAGRMFRCPLGIATDHDGRIWVSEPQSNCIKIFDPSTFRVNSLEELTRNSIGLRCPTGIYRAVNGQMLVADTQNNRILAVCRTGKIEVLFGCTGKGLGEFRHPISFCNAHANGTFWAVDLRNHRVQELRLDGEPIREIGGVGLGMGHLVLPESAAVFDDGVLAVNQWACTKALKLFSPDGKELETIQLDYSPRGMLAHQGFLLVCEGHGNHIYIYERV